MFSSLVVKRTRQKWNTNIKMNARWMKSAMWTQSEEAEYEKWEISESRPTNHYFVIQSDLSIDPYWCWIRAKRKFTTQKERGCLSQ